MFSKLIKLASRKEASRYSHAYNPFQKAFNLCACGQNMDTGLFSKVIASEHQERRLSCTHHSEVSSQNGKLYPKILEKSPSMLLPKRLTEGSSC